MLKKLSIAAGIAALTFSGVAFANGGGWTPATADVTSAIDNGAGFYLGLQAGYSDTHWDNIEPPMRIAANQNGDSFSADNEDGFAGRAYGGYAFNKYLAVEGGFMYLPSDVKMRISHHRAGRIQNWDADFSIRGTIPVYQQFGVLGTVGLSYFDSKDTPRINRYLSSMGSNFQKNDEEHWGVVFGAGVYYDITANIKADLVWKRVEGSGRFNGGYQPSPDVVLGGLSYRFPMDLFSNFFNA